MQIAWHPIYFEASAADQELMRQWAKTWAAELDAKITTDMVAHGETHRLKQVTYTVDNRTYPVGR